REPGLRDVEAVDASLMLQLLQVPGSQVDEGDLWALEGTAGVVPAAAWLLALLADVLADVAHGGVVVAVEFDGGGEAHGPGGKVVDWVPFPVPVAGKNGLHSVVEEAVEVDGPVLVPLRHKDVGQAMAADL